MKLKRRLFLRKHLGKYFGKVSSAGSVEEAEVPTSCNEHPDFDRADIVLPGRLVLNGKRYSTTLTKRADVLMTGYADLEMTISALKLGASDFILKPFNLEQMIKAVPLHGQAPRPKNAIRVEIIC
ncbi:response regulator [Vibrio lentus]|nr:response regulator [Vibrio lentus]